MKINTISPEEFERMEDQESNTQIEKNCTDFSNMKTTTMKKAMKDAMGAILNTDEYEVEEKNDDRIELALSNIRAAMTMCSEGEIKSELRSAEHHLTRGE